MRKQIFIITIGLIIQTGSAWAQISNQAAIWLRIPTDPRSAAMGESLDAVAEGTSALTANPAGLGYLNQTEINFDHDFWIQSVSVEHGAVAMQAGKVGIGLAADYLNVGTIATNTVVNGSVISTGSISPQGFAITGACGSELAPNFYAGAAAKFLEQNLTGSDSETDFAGDVGILFHHESGISAGLALLNFGNQLDGYDLPMQVEGGVSARFPLGGPFGPNTHVASIAASASYLPDALTAGFNVGGEYWYRQFVALRVGYNFADYGQSNDLTGFAFGGGLRLEQFEIAYAMTTMGSVGNNNQVSVTMRF